MDIYKITLLGHKSISGDREVKQRLYAALQYARKMGKEIINLAEMRE